MRKRVIIGTYPTSAEGEEGKGCVGMDRISATAAIAADLSKAMVQKHRKFKGAFYFQLLNSEVQKLKQML